MTTFEAFGQEWATTCPAASEFYRVVPTTPRVDIGFLADFLCAHVTDPEGLRQAMREEPSLMSDDLFQLLDPLMRSTYDGLSYRAVSSLLALWPERRHLHHGRLVAAGNPRGARDLDLYDVFCVVWADLDEAARASSEFTAVNFKNSDKLREQIVGMQGRSTDPQADVDEFRAKLGGRSKRGQQRTAQAESAT